MHRPQRIASHPLTEEMFTHVKMLPGFNGIDSFRSGSLRLLLIEGGVIEELNLIDSFSSCENLKSFNMTASESSCLEIDPGFVVFHRRPISC